MNIYTDQGIYRVAIYLFDEETSDASKLVFIAISKRFQCDAATNSCCIEGNKFVNVSVQVLKSLNLIIIRVTSVSVESTLKMVKYIFTKLNDTNKRL